MTFVLIGLIFIVGCVQEKQEFERPTFPLEPDVIIADVTVTNLALNDECPSHEDSCPEKNPKDSGEIRIDHIITYRRNDPQNKQDNPVYARLTEGKTKRVVFRYSARPANINYEMPIAADDNSFEGPPENSVPVQPPSEGENTTTETTGPPGPDILISSQAGYFRYTAYSENPSYEFLVPYNISIGDTTVLSGLSVGDKIRVYFYYFTQTDEPIEIREYIDAICVNEGELFDVRFGDYCCEGLNRIALTELQEETCEPTGPPSSFVCANCGNGECGISENNCNCPQDCN